MRKLFLSGLVFLLAACGSVPAIPETTYYRLPAPAGIERLRAPVTPRPITVDAFLADGQHNQQAMLYTLDAAGIQLRSYHYQLWAEPPGRMLQRRLIHTLREAGAAGMVVDRLPPGATQMRVRGLITHFERVREGSGSTASLGIQLRVEAPDRADPWLLREYRAEVPAAGASIEAYVAAMGRAVDQAFAEFLRDLEAARP
jgi:cholesterol transport system auxiliary component